MFGLLMSISFILIIAWITEQVYKAPIIDDELDEDYF